MSRKPRLGDIVELDLDDMEQLSGGWQDLADYADQPRQRYSAVGYLIGKTKRWVTVAPVVNATEGGAHSAYRIPAGAVRRVTRLR